jgi:hypothetical protein
MALKGNIKDFSIIQLLNLINLAKKTGALYIESSSKSAKLIFREGKLVYATTGMDAVPLIKIMARSKLIPSSAAASLSERYRTLNDMELVEHVEVPRRQGCSGESSLPARPVINYRPPCGFGNHSIWPQWLFV